MKVAVIGAGPAGLIAAHAAVLAGHRVTVYDRATPDLSRLMGAQFLHAAIPGLPGEPFPIHVKGVGDSKGYAKKVYGYEEAPNSYIEYVGREIMGFSLIRAYAALVEKYDDRIAYMNVTSAGFGILASGQEFDLLVSTMSRTSLCMDPEHVFEDAKVMISSRAKQPDSNVILYNGQPDTLWYRTSTIDGRSSTEYPMESGMFIDEPVRIVTKPTRTDCTCWDSVPHVIFTGRYGAWDKSKLVHHAFEDVESALLAL